MIYAGVFDTRKQAKKELSGLKGDFPGAKVVQVSARRRARLARATRTRCRARRRRRPSARTSSRTSRSCRPSEYQKKARKLPDTTKLPGKAPPKDDKKPGGGGEGDVIE